MQPRGPPAARAAARQEPGSRRVRGGPRSGSRRSELESSGALETAHPPFCDQPFVDRAGAALERRVDGRAQRHRLAVHGPAGGDDEVRTSAISDCASIAWSGTRKPGMPAQRVALRGDPRQHDGLQPRAGAPPLQARQDRAEQVVLEPVVEGDLRRGAHHDDRAALVEPEVGQDQSRLARSPRGSTPPSAPRRAGSCRSPRSARADPAGSRPGPPPLARAGS